MKQYDLTNNSKVLISSNKDSIFLVSLGIESPFYYIEDLKNIFNELKINSKIAKVYVDMFSCVKNDSQRFIKLNYYKNNKMFDTSNIETISYSDLPIGYKKELNKLS